MISSGRRLKWRLNGDAERSSIWSSLPASQFPRDLAQLHAEHFPARRRVITTFCSTNAPFPLTFLIISCLLSHPPFLSVVNPTPFLPSVFLSDSLAPAPHRHPKRFILWLICLCLQPLITTFRERRAMNGIGVYSLTDNKRNYESYTSV